MRRGVSGWPLLSCEWRQWRMSTALGGKACASSDQDGARGLSCILLHVLPLPHRTIYSVGLQQCGAADCFKNGFGWTQSSSIFPLPLSISFLLEKLPPYCMGWSWAPALRCLPASVSTAGAWYHILPKVVCFFFKLKLCIYM